jgi:hypothetical protein
MASETTPASLQWYIVKTEAGHCQISNQPPTDAETQSWGPFDSSETAIARRVGLIRAGQCQPMLAN